MHKRIHDIVSFKFILLFLSVSMAAACHAQSYSEDTVMSSPVVHYFDNMSEETLPSARTVPDSTMRNIRKDDAYWYANLAPKKKKEIEPKEEKTSLFRQSWFKSLLWIVIVAGFVSVLLWYLASGNIRLFRKSSTPIVSEEEPLIAEDIFALDYGKEIENATAEKNYRLATRLLYLRTLKHLSDHGLINYTHERTNSDYLSQLRGTRHYRDFFRLTRDFDYTWYGKFELTGEAFAIVQNDFVNFNQQLA